MALSNRLLAVEEPRRRILHSDVERAEGGHVQLVEVGEAHVDRRRTVELGAGCAEGGLG